MKRYFARLLLFLPLLLCLHSCEENYVTQEGISNVIFSSDQGNRVLIGSEVEIRLETNRGENITHEAQLFVDDELISEDQLIIVNDQEDETKIIDAYVKLSSNSITSFTLKAEYLNLKSSFELNFHDGTDQVFKKRVLIEDYTGTWCGWCPRLSHAMSLASDFSNNVVFSAIHRAPTGTADPYNFEEAEPLEDLIDTPGYPKGFINRVHQWAFPEPDNIAQVLEFTQGERPYLDFAIHSSIENNNLDVDVKTLFTEDYENTKLIVYLQENGLVYPQTNYTSFYNGENPIQNYVHNYTLRKVLTDILGDEISNEESKKGNLLSKTFSITIPEEIENVEQLDLVVFMVDEQNEVINVRKAKVGEDQEFEFD